MRPGIGGEGGLRGVVRKATYLGSHIEYTVETPIGALFVIDGGVASPLPQDSDVAVGLSPQGVTLVRE